MSDPAYAHGVYDVPLIGQTIGANLESTAARFADREAFVSCAQGVRLTYAEFDAAVDRARHGPAGPGHRATATGSGSGRRTARSGRSCSTPRRRSARSSSTSTRPTARTSWPTRCASPGCAAGQRAGVQDQRLRRDGRRGGGRPAGARARRCSSTATRGGSWPRRRRTARRDRRAHGAADVRRPDQHPVHERHHRLPQGRDAQPPQHPQQRLLRRRAARLHGGRPHLHPRAVLPLLRHGHGQPRGDDARRLHGRPGAGVRAGRDAAGGGQGALHRALRRADDVHRRARPTRASPSYDLSSLRTGIMAGSPCPVEVMRRVVERDAHGARSTICYGMTETSPVSTQTRRRRPARAARRDGRAGPARTWRSRSSTRDTGADRAGAARPASCARAATA